LASMSKKASESTYRALEKMGVKLLLNTKVLDYDGKKVIIEGENPIPSRTVVWAAGVKGQAPGGFDQEIYTRGQRLKTDLFNRVEGYKNIYALGDLAAMCSSPYKNGHPMLAQVAIQQGRCLGKNFQRQLLNKPFLPFHYNDKGTMATIGRKKAVAEIGRIKTNGFMAWLLWSLVHLVSISGFRNKLIVGLNWIWSYITFDQGNRLIIRKFTVATDSIKENPNPVKIINKKNNSL